MGSPKLSVYDQLNYEIFKKILNKEIQHGTKEETFLMLEYALGLTPQYYEGGTESIDEVLQKIKDEAVDFVRFCGGLKKARKLSDHLPVLLVFELD